MTAIFPRLDVMLYIKDKIIIKNEPFSLLTALIEGQIHRF